VKLDYSTVDRTRPALKGKVALVTGSGSGIGRAISAKLADNGANLCLVDKISEKLEDVSRSAKAAGIKVAAVQTDLACMDQINAVKDQVMRAFGSLDILVHAAGIICQATIDKANLDDFSRQIAVNVIAPYALTKDLLPMLRSSRGHIIFINSSILSNPGVGTIQYAAAKHALKGIADGLRSELNQDGIRVLSLFPGRTATPMQQKIFAYEGREYIPENLLQPEDIAEILVNVLTLPPTAEVTDIHLRPAIKH
jgi:NAD(P)-dependent dehydrogenase (short-subunit alcohol dehydrogenase family)